MNLLGTQSRFSAHGAAWVLTLCTFFGACSKADLTSSSTSPPRFDLPTSLAECTTGGDDFDYDSRWALGSNCSPGTFAYQIFSSTITDTLWDVEPPAGSGVQQVYFVRATFSFDTLYRTMGGGSEWRGAKIVAAQFVNRTSVLVGENLRFNHNVKNLSFEVTLPVGADLVLLTGYVGSCSSEYVSPVECAKHSEVVARHDEPRLCVRNTAAPLDYCGASLMSGETNVELGSSGAAPVANLAVTVLGKRQSGFAWQIWWKFDEAGSYDPDGGPLLTTIAGISSFGTVQTTSTLTLTDESGRAWTAEVRNLAGLLSTATR